jgi:CRISPR-associated protein Csd1
MLLQDLNDYYQEVLKVHPEEISHPGWNSRKVAAYLVINTDGRIVSVIQAGDAYGVPISVPEQESRAYGIVPYFLCDKSTYLLGSDNNGKPERALRAFEQSKALHEEVLKNVDSPVAKSILRFYSSWDPSRARSDSAFSDKQTEDLVFSGKRLLLAAVIDGQVVLAINDTKIQNAWLRYYYEPSTEDIIGRCLVTGERAAIAIKHPQIKGIKNAQSSGAFLVSFNTRSGESYGHVKEQGLNAPVSKEAAQGYGAALNYLLASPIHHTDLGEMTIVYWSRENDDQNSAFISSLAFQIIGAGDSDQEQKHLDAIIRSAISGRYLDETDLKLDSPFFIVGLVPNAARISVRYYLTGTFGSFVENIAEHYRRCEVVHAPQSKEYLSPRELLKELENPKSKNPVYQPTLGVPLMRSIFTNSYYPESLFSSAIERIRASQNDDEKKTRKVDRGRAAIIRAYLLKNAGHDRKEFPVAVNENSQSVAYNLGRLFAILELLQYKANKSSNIANRYMDSASATPSVVFPVLLRLSNAHLNKLGHMEPGRASWYKRQIGELLDSSRIQHFPSRLTLTEQGEFFLGYYQQLNTKSSEKKEQ